MIVISPLTSNFQYKPVNSKKNFLTFQKDVVSFSGKYSIGKLPESFNGVDILALTKDSKNVLAVNDIGYLAEIIKYFDPKSKKTYAIKRVWSPEKAKHQTADPIKQMEIEANVYQKLKGIKNIPQFYFYNGNFAKEKNSFLNNYLIVGWMDGVPVSSKGAYYDFDLVTTKNIKKIFELLNKFDNAGVIHNDLWAANILFQKNNVNIIDFNRSYVYNQHKDFRKNNLDSFKVRFLNRYFSDVYQRQGESNYLNIYKACLNFEKDYYESKQAFYLKNKNNEASLYYQECADKLKNEVKNPELMRQNAMKTIFESDIHTGDSFAKYFEFEEGEAIFNYKNALDVLKKNPDIIEQGKYNLIKSNIFIANKLSELINNQKSDDVEKILKLLNDSKIYDAAEIKKPYYEGYKNFCEFSIKYKNLSESAKSTTDLIQEYQNLFLVKRLKNYFNSLLIGNNPKT